MQTRVSNKDGNVIYIAHLPLDFAQALLLLKDSRAKKKHANAFKGRLPRLRRLFFLPITHRSRSAPDPDPHLAPKSVIARPWKSLWRRRLPRGHMMSALSFHAATFFRALSHGLLVRLSLSRKRR